jgi:hypothetical protein
MIDDDFASDDVDLEQAERREFMRRLREQNLRALTRNRESLLVHTLQLPVTDPIQEWRAWHDQRDAERAAETERRRQRESDEAEIAEALAIAADTIERLEQHVDKLEARITSLRAGAIAAIAAVGASPRNAPNPRSSTCRNSCNQGSPAVCVSLSRRLRSAHDHKSGNRPARGPCHPASCAGAKDPQ